MDSRSDFLCDLEIRIGDMVLILTGQCFFFGPVSVELVLVLKKANEMFDTYT